MLTHIYFLCFGWSSQIGIFCIMWWINYDRHRELWTFDCLVSCSYLSISSWWFMVIINSCQTIVHHSVLSCCDADVISSPVFVVIVMLYDPSLIDWMSVDETGWDWIKTTDCYLQLDTLSELLCYVVYVQGIWGPLCRERNSLCHTLVSSQSQGQGLLLWTGSLQWRGRGKWLFYVLYFSGEYALKNFTDLCKALYVMASCS